MNAFLQHLEARGYNSNISASINYQDEIVSFPLYTLDGKRVGYQNYRWNYGKKLGNDETFGRYFTYLSGAYKGNCFYGTEYLSVPGPLFITDGIWDCISIINAGYCCIALLGDTPSQQLKHLIKTAINKVTIAVVDNDKNSGKLANVADCHFTTAPYQDMNNCPHNLVKPFIQEKLCLLNF